MRFSQPFHQREGKVHVASFQIPRHTQVLIRTRSLCVPEIGLSEIFTHIECIPEVIK